MRTDTRGAARLRVWHDGDLEGGGPSRGEGGIRHPLVRPQEREHTPAAAVRKAVLEAGGVPGAQGQPRELRAAQTRAAQARRPRAALRGRGAPRRGRAGGGRCAVLRCEMRQGMQSARVWGFFFFFFLLVSSRLLPPPGLSPET